MGQPDFGALVDRFRTPEIRAIALMGSFARGDVGRFSDVDLVRFLGQETETDSESQTHIINNRLVVVSEVTPAAVNDWFSKPEIASEYIKGVQTAKPLWDAEGHFQEIQARARSFVWDASMQEKADRWASQELVGWAEEVHKGIDVEFVICNLSGEESDIKSIVTKNTAYQQVVETLKERGFDTGLAEPNDRSTS